MFKTVETMDRAGAINVAQPSNRRQSWMHVSDPLILVEVNFCTETDVSSLCRIN